MNTNIKKDVFIAKFIEEEDIFTNISYKIELFTSKNKFKIFNIFKLFFIINIFFIYRFILNL